MIGEKCGRCSNRLKDSKDGKLKAVGHAPGCFEANRVKHVIHKTTNWSPTTREQKDPREKRREALSTLEDFADWLHLNPGNGPRRLLSPRKAKEYLANPDVQDLLGDDRVERIRRAAEVLST